MLHSDYRPLTDVRLPYQGRQRYMHSFDLAKPVMAEGFEDYLEPVNRLIEAAGQHTGIAHMTVDEKIVMPGMSQRRPGPHVDGCYLPGEGRWGGGWNHYYNHIPMASGYWTHDPPTPGPGRPWIHRDGIRRMSVIVASSVAGCRVWRGEFDGEPTDSGDLSHIASQLGEGEVLPANIGYQLSPDCVHESMRFATVTQRSFLRVALPLN